MYVRGNCDLIRKYLVSQFDKKTKERYELNKDNIFDKKCCEYYSAEILKDYKIVFNWIVEFFSRFYLVSDDNNTIKLNREIPKRLTHENYEHYIKVLNTCWAHRNDFSYSISEFDDAVDTIIKQNYIRK
jgi:hypothetical protein